MATRPGGYFLSLMLRIGLFILIVSLGMIMAWAAGEVKTRASVAPARTMTTAVSGSVLYAALIDDLQPSQIYRSENKGQTWLPLSSELVGPIFVLESSTPGEVVLYGWAAGPAAPSYKALWRSQDGGQTWLQFVPGLADHPYGLPSTDWMAGPPTLTTKTSGRGDGYFGPEHNPYSYKLVGALSLYNYRNYQEGTVIGPEGRVYTLAGADFYTAEESTWQKFALLRRLATGLVTLPGDGAGQPANWHEGYSQELWRDNSAGFASGPVIRITALARDVLARYVAATVTYSSDYQIVDRGIYASSDGGRLWTQLAHTSGLMVMQLPAQPLAELTSAPVQPVEPMIRPSLASSPHLSPLAALSETQLLILVLAFGLGGLTLLDKHWTYCADRTPV